jgi:serine/threonine protein kinase
VETIKICPNCRKPLPPDVPLGLCPECLIKAGFPTGTEPGTAAEAAATRFVPPPVAEIAQLFPQLEILRLIGQGGMGAVYQARQPALDRFVALKVLPPALGSDPGFAERFNREARALARLNHPNIVAVHDFGKAGALHYLLMEFVDGANLREIEQAGGLKPEQALAIVPQICEALQFAHNEGIVHRDIKPENLLMDKKGRVKITDFGIAKIVGAPAGKVSLTGVKDVVGTPHYMAPEQIEHPQAVDHRADIYSLGVVFYEMLTGELPLGKFQPPSAKVQIDVRLDEVVLHALEKEPARRYQHVSEVKTQMEIIANTSAPTTAPTVSPEEILARDYTLNIRNCLRRGWALVRNDFWPLVGMSAFVLAVLSAAPSSGVALSDGHSSGTISVLGILLSGPLLGGLYLYFLKKIRREEAGVETAFTGFRHPFPHLVIAGFLTSLLTGLGFVCLILPGIYLFAAWLFTFPLIVDRRLDFWPAMRLSRKVISKHWWKFLGFLIVLALINLAGILACGVGLFITFPITFAALTYAYEDITGAVKSPPSTSSSIPSIAPTTPQIPQPDRFWRRFAVVMACVVLIPIVIAVLGMLVAIAIPNFVRARQHAQAQHEHELASQAVAIRSDYIGNAWFPQGDSIEITSVERTADQMVVKGHYSLVSHDSALLALYITTTNSAAVPTDPKQQMQIPKGRGDFELIHSHLVPGLPHVSMNADGKSFAELYFGIKAEALEESEAGRITDAPSASAETWSPTPVPGGKVDLQKILQEAQDLMSQGRDEEALQRLIWYHDHSMSDPSQTGVRNSFALSYWVELGRRYPNAKQALLEIRDHDTQEFTGGRGNFDLFMEVSSINHYLGDDDATYGLFQSLRQQDKALTQQCYELVQGLLVQRGEYDLCLSYLGDPQTAFERIRQSWERMKHWEDQQAATRRQGVERLEAMARTNALFANGPVPFLPELPKFADRQFVDQTRQLIEILVGAGQNDEAEKIQNQAVAVLDDALLKSAVSDAQEKINLRRGILGAITITNSTQGTIQILPVDATNAVSAEPNDLRGARAKLAELRIDYGEQSPEIQGVLMRIKELERLTKGEPNLPADLREAKAHLAELAADYSPQNPVYLRQQARIRALEQEEKEHPDEPADLREAKAHLAELRVDYAEQNPRIQEALARIKELEQSNVATTETNKTLTGQPPVAIETQAVSETQAWLALIDAGNYSESWKEASAIFQGAVTEAAWENSMNTFRQPLGDLVSRKLKSVQSMTEMPGAPDGQYVVMQFETSFANKKSAVETVTFLLEKDGQWKSTGYFIK